MIEETPHQSNNCTSAHPLHTNIQPTDHSPPPAGSKTHLTLPGQNGYHLNFNANFEMVKKISFQLHPSSQLS